MFTITNDSINTYICSDTISDLFKDDDLNSIKIDIVKNCCDAVQTETINLIQTDDFCFNEKATLLLQTGGIYRLDNVILEDGQGNQIVYTQTPSYIINLAAGTLMSNEAILTSLESSMNAFLTSNSIDATIDLYFNGFIFTYEFISETHNAISFQMTETNLTASDDVSVQDFSCDLTANIDTSCVWTVTFTDDNIKAINTILVYNDGIYSESLMPNYESLDDLDVLATNINALLTTGTFAIDLTDGLYTVTLTGVDFFPDYLIAESENGAKTHLKFICEDVVLFPDTYNPDLIEISANCLVLKPAWFSGEDGIYNFTITTETETTILTEKHCLFIDNDIKCTISGILEPTNLVKAYSLYEGIKFAEGCGDCECEDACVIYKELLDFLKRINDNEC